MKDKEKQIEEKDKLYILNTILQEVKPLKLREKIYWRIVEFINKKLPKNSVVLSREEYQKLNKKIYDFGIEIELKINQITNLEREINKLTKQSNIMIKERTYDTPR